MHNLSETSRSEGHNLRTRYTPNANPMGPPPRLVFGSPGLSKTLKAIIPVKRRKDAVIAVETVLTASPAFFDSCGSLERLQRIDRWVDACEGFLLKEYGPNVLQIILHTDEATPHIHCTWVPMKEGRLSYSAISGSIKDMVRKQTDFAKAMEQFGMVRGQEGNKRRHEHHSKVVDDLRMARHCIKSASVALLAITPHIHTIDGINALKMVAERLFDPEPVAATAKIEGEESAVRRGPVDMPKPQFWR